MQDGTASGAAIPKDRRTRLTTGGGFAVGSGGPSRDMMIRKATPKGATGRVYGTVYSGLDVGFAIAPVVFGVVMDRGWYAATLVGASITLTLSVVAAVFAVQTVGSRDQIVLDARIFGVLAASVAVWPCLPCNTPCRPARKCG